MGRITRLTERDLTRLVRRVIKENKTKKKPVNEGLNDYLTLIGGTLVSFAAIKLFGRKILVQLFGLFSKGLIKSTCYKELESIMELISKDTDNLQVEYKKIKDYYQIIIDMKSFSSEYSFTDTKDYKAGQLDSYNFPAKLKLYDDGTVEYLCNTGEVIREKSKGNIYDNFVNFIKSYGEENPKIRGYAEDKEIFKVLNKTLKPNFQSKVEQYNSLASMDSNVIDKMASEISKKLDIPQELIANAMERHQPTEMKDEETISTDRYYSPIWDFINDVYKDITESNNNESLKESDLTRIVKRAIKENFKEISWEDIWFKLRRLSQSFQFPDDVYTFGGLDFMDSEDGESLDLMDIYKDPYMWRDEYDEGVEVLEKYSNKIKNFVDEFNLKYDYPFTLMFKMDSKYNMKFYTED
jgi:hypothetical protein